MKYCGKVTDILLMKRILSVNNKGVLKSKLVPDNYIDTSSMRKYWEGGLLETWWLDDSKDIYDESLVREFWDKITNFRKLFVNKHFSEDFLREVLTSKTRFKFRNWDLVSQTQFLSEQFIEEFADKWNWDNIFMYQTISKDFIHKHKEKISDFVMNETDIGAYL